MDTKLHAEFKKDKFIKINRRFIELTGDNMTGILLTEIVNYFTTANDKFFVERENKKWMIRGRKEWRNICSIVESQYDRSVKILRQMCIVETKIFKVNGEPTTHITLNTDNLINLVNDLDKG